MLGRLATWVNQRGAITAPLPLEGTVYVVGDIHGNLAKLQGLLKRIKGDSAKRTGPFTLVFLGDVINRGPDSAGVVKTLRTGLPKGWKIVTLRGNHEQALLDFLNQPDRYAHWLGWGGAETCQSYGIQPFGAKGLRAPAALAAEMAHELEKRGDRVWLEATVLSHVIGPYAFVHAGVRPGVALASQMPEDLLFIREDWANRPHQLPFTVIYGHTIYPEPLVANDRIGIDTGAYLNGPLTAAVLTATQPPEFLQQA